MTHKKFAICVSNKDYEVSLELLKLYEILPDSDADKHDQVRVVDESGDDYLFPAKCFAGIELPQPVESLVISAAEQGAAADGQKAAPSGRG